MLFEDVKCKGSSQQIPFTGIPFVTFGYEAIILYTWSRSMHFNKEQKIREKKINRYEANLARTPTPSMIFLLEKLLFRA